MRRPLGLAAVRRAVVAIVSEALESDVPAHADLPSLRLTSMQMTWIIGRFEDELGLRAPAWLFFDAYTVEDIVTGVFKEMNDS